MKKSNSKNYIKVLEERKSENKNRVTHSYQSIGLDIAEMLDDVKHKSLYIKLAKEHDESLLLKTAKEVVSRSNIKNKGAYFMRVLHEELNK